jgi:hypothetical protein
MGFTRKLGESSAHRRGCCLDNLAANIANEKHDRLLLSVPMAAGEKGIAGRKPVHEPIFEQKIQRPIDRNRSRPLAGRLRYPIDHLVGPKRAAFPGKDLKNTPPPRGQTYIVATAGRQRSAPRARGATLRLI